MSAEKFGWNRDQDQSAQNEEEEQLEVMSAEKFYWRRDTPLKLEKSNVRAEMLKEMEIEGDKAGDCLLQFAEYNWEVFVIHEKHSGSESTLINWLF